MIPCSELTWLGLQPGQWVTIAVGLVATIGVVLGWFFTSWLASRRDHHNRQLSMIIDYLMDAYESFAMAANRPPSDENKANMKKVELAVAKVQLFGSPTEIAATQEFIQEYMQPQPDGLARADLDRLLLTLRNSLRERLALNKIDTPVHWFRPYGGAQ